MAVSIGRFSGTRLQVLAALAVGLCFRLWLAAAFPYEAGDTPLYEALARNLDAHGAYALEIEGRPVPVNVRMPGYPAFLAACHALFGPGFRPVRVAQAVIDTLTCLLAGALATLLASPGKKRRAFLAGLWLAALCPFTANYVAAVLAESPGAFWNTGSFALLLLGVRRLQAHEAGDRGAWLALLGSGLSAGVGCYFRPETPLVLAAAAVVLPWLWWRPRDWRRLLGTGCALGLGLGLALAPWAARNVAALGRFEVLPPPAANLPGEMAPVGFNEWLATWLTTNKEIYDFSFKVEDEPLLVEELPPSAYDSPQEKERVAQLFAQHNSDFTLTPELDGGFAQLARERTARHPLRTYLMVPLKRALTMWISPRLELLPWSGEVFPLRQCWEDDPYDLSVTVALFTTNLLYIVLALVALRRASWRTGAALLAAYLLLRTALITQMPGPEPRYVVTCFPLLAALAAQLWARPAAPAAAAGR
jgi:4-amino-4-deoxy-L-arabinose transferase-like glycosyltransferase